MHDEEAVAFQRQFKGQGKGVQLETAFQQLRAKPSV